MVDGVNIDWGLAGQPVNAFGSYQTGFDLGRKAAGDRIQGNAMTAYMADPTAPVDPRLGAANPELAMKVYAAQQGATDHAAAVDATTAMASGDIDGAKAAIAPTGNFGAMGQILDWAKTASDEQKAAVAEKAGHVAQITTAIATMPADPSQPNGPLASPAQRLSVAQHMATIHPEYGIDPASLTVDQFTDDGIRATVAQQLGVKGMLVHDLAVHKQNTEDATAADTANYHAGQLKIDAGKLGVEQGQLHVAQQHLALDTASSLTPEAVDYAAHDYLSNGGKMPALGRTSGDAQKRIMNRVAEIQASTGQTAQDAALTHASIKAGSAALTAQTKKQAFLETNAAEASKMGDLALSLAAKGGGTTGAPVVNRWIQAGRKSLAGDADVNNFNIAMGGFAEKYAQVIRHAGIAAES